MSLTSFIAAVCVLFTCQTPGSISPPRPSRLAKDLAPSIVKIYTETKRGPAYTGTGWLYQDEHIMVTAGHVIKKENGKPEDPQFVEFIDHSTTKITTRIDGKEDDVAVCQLEPEKIDKHRPVLTLSSKNPISGDLLFKLGYPGELVVEDNIDFPDLELGYHKGEKFMGEKGDGRVFWCIRHSVWLRPGDSGSPLFDEWGKVVGVNVASGTKYDDYSVTLTHLQKVLPKMIEELKKK